MRKGGILSYAVLIVLVAVLVLVFAHHGSQAASAALPAPSPAPTRSSATSLPEPQQFPVADAIANKIIQKYQTSTCEQLWQERAQPKKPKSQQEQEAIAILRQDAQMRAHFLGKVAPPIANKMFECGMIP